MNDLKEDFDDKTKICAPPTRALAAAIWPHLFASPAPEHITELSAEEVAEIVGDDCRVTAEYPMEERR